MRSPKDMGIIQIDVTNACVHKCSNCTRFCGHHKKPFFMDFETFKKAVDSLDDFEGVVGMIGGEPTLHPDFEKMVKYLRQKRLKTSVNTSREPILDFNTHIAINLNKNKNKKAGLWSSLTKQYYRYFELINDSFDCQLLNDHNNTCMHQALLMSRKELNISDEEFFTLRDKCWIQNTWSATITPKGAFFCEVAGALDMLFNGPGGWPIEKDWWKREPKDFKDQLHWCELCSCAFDVPTRLSSDGRDDVTPLIYDKLQELKSPKALNGQVIIHTKEEYSQNKSKYHRFMKGSDYIEVNASTRAKNSKYLLPKNFTIYSFKKFDEYFNCENPKEKPMDWIILTNKSDKKANYAVKKLQNVILNPGCIYKYKKMYLINVLAESIRNIIGIKQIKSTNIEKYYPCDKIIQYHPLKLLFKYHFRSRIGRLYYKLKLSIMKN